jgi:hypothetical protein
MGDKGGTGQDEGEKQVEMWKIKRVGVNLNCETSYHRIGPTSCWCNGADVTNYCMRRSAVD